MVVIGGRTDIGQNAQNDANDPERHFGRIVCCGAQCGPSVSFPAWDNPRDDENSDAWAIGGLACDLSYAVLRLSKTGGETQTRLIEVLPENEKQVRVSHRYNTCSSIDLL